MLKIPSILTSLVDEIRTVATRSFSLIVTPAKTVLAARLSLMSLISFMLLLILMSWSVGLQANEFSSATTQYPVYEVDNKIVLGRVERVYYSDIDALSGIPFIGKIDTGADTTSMHADNIQVFSDAPELQGLPKLELLKALEKAFDKTPNRVSASVSFTLRHPYTGKEVKVQRPLENIGVIRSRTSETPLYRPVIRLPLTIAGKTVNTKVNLTDRGNFSASILIGKSFLEHNAWVLAGYDYLQQQPNSKIVGKKEQLELAGLPIETRFLGINKYSNMHAENIHVDPQAQRVTFEMISVEGIKKMLSLPLVRMLNVNGHERPLVNLPVMLGDEVHYMQAYLKDRGESSSILIVGQDTLNQYFMIDTDEEDFLATQLKAEPSTKNGKVNASQYTYQQRIDQHKPLVVSTFEHVVIDGYKLQAEPSFTVKTPMLKVESYEMTTGASRTVSYYLKDSAGNKQKITKPVIKRIKVGNSVRPIIEGDFELGGRHKTLQFALETLDQDKENDAYFVIGKKMVKDGVLINTRSDHLLEDYPLFRAGHIEKATVEGMTFPVKLDTGADVSSMHALNIKQFKQDGKPMVSFTYQNEQGQKQDFTRPMVDVMRIKAKKGEKPTIRPVVEMNVQLGKVNKTIRVNLQDRSRFRYSMILGKNLLKYGALVGSDEDYLLNQ